VLSVGTQRRTHSISPSCSVYTLFAVSICYPLCFRLTLCLAVSHSVSYMPLPLCSWLVWLVDGAVVWLVDGAVVGAVDGVVVGAVCPHGADHSTTLMSREAMLLRMAV
jgi:hypothetical protein